jgi:hypothetical protein
VDFALDLWVAPITKRILGHLGYLELPTVPWLCYQPSVTDPETPGLAGTDVHNHFDIVRVSRFDQEADALWKQINQDFGIATVRSAAYLNWKFVDQPHMGYEIFEARRRATLRGIAILRRSRHPEPGAVVLGDLISSRDDSAALGALCQFVRRRYAALGRTIVTSTSVTEYRHALRTCGFVETPRPRPVSPFIWCRHPPADLARLAETMLVGRADSDWDQYPYAGMA